MLSAGSPAMNSIDFGGTLLPASDADDQASDSESSQLLAGLLFGQTEAIKVAGPNFGRLLSERTGAVDRVGMTDLWGGPMLTIAPADALVPFGMFRFDLPSEQNRDHQNTLTPEVFDKVVVGSTAVVSTSLSVGYVIWILRGGSLLTAFISAMPAWQSFDPLPILQPVDNDDDVEQDDETLLTLVTRTAVKAVRGT